MSIVDAHVHFWDPRETPRAVTTLVRTLGFSPNLVDWVARRLFPRDVARFFSSPKFITRPYLPVDFHRDCGSTPIHSVVHVEAGWKGRGILAPVAETRWLDRLAAVGAFHIGAIVAHADLGLGASVVAVLRAHVEASNRVRGIRDMLAWHPSRSIMSSAATPEKSRDQQWRLAFERLSEMNLNFDATCYDHQLPELADLANSYPDQRIILCHAGNPVGVGGPFGEYGHTPTDRHRIFGRWQEGMARLAECRNIAVKISGLTMPVCGFGFETWRKPPSDGL